jgi:hypothetical protein
MLNYLLEFHHQDGRPAEEVAFDWDTASFPLHVGMTVEVDFEGVPAWEIASKLPVEGYARKIVLRELSREN